MDGAVAGPSSAPLSSFHSFASCLADSRHLDAAARLASGLDGDDVGSGTALRFAQVCSKRAEDAEAAGLGQKVTLGGLDDDETDEDRLNWTLEARTWELLHSLCADRYLYHPADEDEDANLAELQQARDALFYQTPFDAVQDILHRNRGLRELKVSRAWTV